MVEKFSSYRVILKYAQQSALEADELARIMAYKDKVSAIESNITKGIYNVLEGLSFDQKRELLAYLLFAKENAFTNPGKGNTLIIDSARTAIRHPEMFAEDPKGLDYEIIAGLNRQNGLMSTKLDVDFHGIPCVPKGAEEK